MAAATYVVTASQPGTGSAVVTETTTKTMNVADIGVVTEGGTSGGGGAAGSAVRVLVLA